LCCNPAIELHPQLANHIIDNFAPSYVVVAQLFNLTISQLSPVPQGQGNPIEHRASTAHRTPPIDI
jgi:hypothetical protein